MLRGAIVLCGGQSRRMGTAKADLPFGPERMLQRVVRLVGEAVDRVVVVAAPGQVLPPLPDDILRAEDRRPGRGPLEGLRAGLEALPPEVEAAYATSCDVPLLLPDFVRRLFELLGHCDVAVPVTEGFHHPLAAVYRRTALPAMESLLSADRLRPVFLFEAVATRRVRAEELVGVDPQLRTLRNCNHPEEYLAALAEAGYTCPAELAARWSAQGDTSPPRGSSAS